MDATNEGVRMKYIIKINGKSHEVEIEEKGSMYVVSVDGVPYEAHITEKREEITEHGSVPSAAPALTLSAPTLVSPTAPGQVTAPMPGTILQVHVSTGDTVSVGDVLFTLEAMKMENHIPSPVSGTVHTVSVKEGQTVNTGDVLAVIS